MNILGDQLMKSATGKRFCVAVSSRMDTIFLVMLLESMKSGITDTIKVNKHFFADDNGLKLIGTPGTSTSFQCSHCG